jgi:hypothetical protein
MNLTITPQSIITAGAVIGALVALITYFTKVVRWVDRQKAQDVDLTNLGKRHDKEMDILRSDHSRETKEIKEEQTILTYGILACLKGLHEQGCNGPVTEAIKKIETHLNEKAHE